MVEAEAKNRFSNFCTPFSAEELNLFADWLIKELIIIADLFTPKKTPSIGRGCSWWLPKVKEAVRDSEKA